MTVNDRAEYYFKLIQMHKCINQPGPTYMMNLFVPTRNDNILLPRANRNSGKRMFKYSGAVLWNNLNHDIKRSSSLDVFKQNIRQFFIDRNISNEASDFIFY